MGTIQRISSEAHPHANQRAEGAVKAVKRMLTDCMGPGGNLTGDRFMRALMEHRNTPLRELKKSPAQLMLGRRLRNVLPLAPSMLTQDTSNILTTTEQSNLLEKNYASTEKRLNEGTRLMETIAPGTPVRVQNQSGPSQEGDKEQGL